MKLINKLSNDKVTLKGFFNDDERAEIKTLLKTKNQVTEYLDQNLAFICLGKKSEFDLEGLKCTISAILKLNTRSFQIDSTTFVNDKVNLETVINKFVDLDEYLNGDDLYSAKTVKKDKTIELSILVPEKELEEKAKRTISIAKLVNKARYFQATPPNICNSEWLADQFVQMFKDVKSPNVKVTVLNKKEIEQQKMGLFLSVNMGSGYEPRLVVIEYNGDPKSKEKIALVGKGITFDSGGYNLKGSQHILGMKFDMSGAAISAAVLKGVIEQKPKVNVVAVLPLTDNKISSFGQTPDSIWTSMSGKTVEVNNTDAEGRLILADAITYAIKKTNATEIIDIATLTGAIVIALGETYTGVWSTCCKRWEEFQMAANQQDELVWRMPFHKDFAKNIKDSKFADYKNTDLSGKGGSNSAAMFLKEFTEDKPYLHLDIAGTGGTGDIPRGIMVKTLIQYLVNKEKNK